MDKDKLQELAMDYCNKMGYHVNDAEEKMQLANMFSQFLQSMIEKGKVFEAQDYESLKEASQKLDGLLTNIRSHADLSDFYIEWIDRVRNETDELTAPRESTVSSAGKEVTDEEIINHFNIHAVADGHGSWTDVLRNFDLSPKDVNNIMLNAVKSILTDQIKATPVKVISDQDIEAMFSHFTPNAASIMIRGVKIYREQLNQKP